MNHGYARCSTNESKQDIDRQVRELKQAGAESMEFVARPLSRIETIIPSMSVCPSSQNGVSMSMCLLMEWKCEW